jgi:hypothetical protein
MITLTTDKRLSRKERIKIEAEKQLTNNGVESTDEFITYLEGDMDLESRLRVGEELTNAVKEQQGLIATVAMETVQNMCATVRNI